MVVARFIALAGVLVFMSFSGTQPAAQENEEVTVSSVRTLTLEEARRLALESNLDLKATREVVARASLVRSKAWSLVTPSVNAQGVATIYDGEVTVELGPGQEVVIRPQAEFRAVGTISERLDGRVLPQLDSAFELEKLAKLSQAELEMELGYAVTQLYFQLLTLDKFIEISRNSLESRLILLKASEDRLAAGAGTSFEVTRARTEVKRARGDLERSRLSFINARLELAKILMTEADFSTVEPASPSLPTSLEESKRIAMNQRVDLAKAKIDLSLAGNEIDTLYWSYAPTLLTQIQITQQSETAFNPDALSWQLQLIASWNIYDGGLREVQIEEARSIFRERQISQTKVEKAIETELLQAMETLRSHEIQVATSKDEVALAELGNRQAQDGFRLGILTQLEVLDAELSLRIAKTRHANDLLDLNLARFSLRRTMGMDVRE